MHHPFAHPAGNPETPTSELLGEERGGFGGGDCSPEDAGSSSPTPASKQRAQSSSFGGSRGEGSVLVRPSPFLGCETSSFPGGNTMVGFTHIHRLGSVCGPVQRESRLGALVHGVGGPAGPWGHPLAPTLTISIRGGAFPHRQWWRLNHTESVSGNWKRQKRVKTP